MVYDPERHYRRTLRWSGYDYSQPGGYFVTLCTENRACILGDVVRGEMRASAVGRMIESVWNEIPAFYPGVATDAFVVMPNHIHGILLIGSPDDPSPTIDDPGVRSYRDASCSLPTRESERQKLTSQSLPTIVQRFKSLTTKFYSDGVRQLGWPRLPGRLWQRNYYDHVLRDEDSLIGVRRYIVDNPAQWMIDRENPEAKSGRVGDPSLP